MICTRSAVSVITVVAIVAATMPAWAHEMFLKPSAAIVGSQSDQVVRLINGTFEKSENSISRDRMDDVSIVANGGVIHPPLTAWYDDSDSSYLAYRAGDPGTYVIGVSTRPRIIAMSPADFVDYLKHDGVLDTLATFAAENTLLEVRERYSKHVRTLVQVGKETSADYATRLGYPVEILLDQNPYELRVGEELSFRVLFNGKPAANQLVRARHAGFHGNDASGGHQGFRSLRTDEDGRASFELSGSAVWYIALIHMQKVDDDEADYESNWATVTFEVR